MALRDTQLSHFPVFMAVEDRKVAVFGNGDEALAKTRLLLNSRASIAVYADAPDASLSAFIADNEISHVRAAYDAGQLGDAVLVFAATGDEALDARIVADARALNIPANAVDRPDLCDFYTPALVNRAPVAVAIGTQGAGPVLAQIIRARVDQLLPPSLGRLARFAAGYRTAVERLAPAGAARRDFWRRFFTGPVARAVAADDEALARRAAARLLGAAGQPDGHVWLVGAGPGDEDLLTLRAQRALMEADVIIHEAAVPQAIVDLGRRDAERHAAATRDDAVNASVEAARSGRRVVLLVPGDAAGLADILRAAAAATISIEIVPGIAGALPDAIAASQAA